jgi:hypothetical protein
MLPDLTSQLAYDAYLLTLVESDSIHEIIQNILFIVIFNHRRVHNNLYVRMVLCCDEKCVNQIRAVKEIIRGAISLPHVVKRYVE